MLFVNLTITLQISICNSKSTTRIINKKYLQNMQNQMTKLNLTISLVLALFMASCSSDDDLTTKITPAQWSNEVENSEVKILLSSEDDNTRAAVDSDNDGVFIANGLGVFCLATDYIAQSNIDIDWQKGSDAFKYSVWVDNAKINATRKNGKTNLSWDDGKSRWYPSGNWHKYGFYGYYPIVDDENISYTSTSITATIPLDGTQDVIYGTAISDEDKAYSRDYFKGLNKYKVPKMDFEHRFMRIKFRFTAGNVDGKPTDALNTGIKKIEVVNVPNEVRMVIADKNNSGNNGTLSFTHDMNNSFELKTSDNANGIASLYKHKNGDENTPLACWITEEWQSIGQGVLLPVPASAEDHYYVRLTLVNTEGKEVVSAPVAIENKTPFVAGMSYRVDLTIRGVNAIQTQLENQQ